MDTKGHRADIIFGYSLTSMNCSYLSITLGRQDVVSLISVEYGLT